VADLFPILGLVGIIYFFNVIATWTSNSEVNTKLSIFEEVPLYDA